VHISSKRPYAVGVTQSTPPYISAAPLHFSVWKAGGGQTRSPPKLRGHAPRTNAAGLWSFRL